MMLEIFGAVMILLGGDPDWYRAIDEMMFGRSFLNMLCRFDVNSVT